MNRAPSLILQVHHIPRFPATVLSISICFRNTRFRSTYCKHTSHCLDCNAVVQFQKASDSILLKCIHLPRHWWFLSGFPDCLRHNALNWYRFLCSARHWQRLLSVCRSGTDLLKNIQNFFRNEESFSYWFPGQATYQCLPADILWQWFHLPEKQFFSFHEAPRADAVGSAVSLPWMWHSWG